MYVKAAAAKHASDTRQATQIAELVRPGILTSPTAAAEDAEHPRLLSEAELERVGAEYLAELEAKEAAEAAAAESPESAAPAAPNSSTSISSGGSSTGTIRSDTDFWTAHDLDKAYECGWRDAMVSFGPVPLDRERYQLAVEDMRYRHSNWKRSGRL